MSSCCRLPHYNSEDEKTCLSKMFMFFIVMQSFTVTVLCIISITYFTQTNINVFLSVDIITLFIAVIILSITLIVVGWGSASSNATFAWYIFHFFMFALLIIEIMVSYYTSNLSSFITTLTLIWNNNEEDERLELQEELKCCGLKNFTNPDGLNKCPKEAKFSCLDRLRSILITLRNVSIVAMFVCIVIGIFIDFVGCALCFHPDIITLADQERELDELAAHQMDLQEHDNPFAAI